MTEDTLNIEEIKMHNKTVSKILVAIIMTSMLLAVLPALPVSATTLASITPTAGNVGTVVRVIGTIDTQGGQYSIYFDTNSNGNALDDGPIKTANAPANSYAVNDTFTIPACLGSDAGSAHPILLRDDQTATSQSMSFAVVTKRTVTTAAYDQEGNVVAVTVTVSGGTTALQANNFAIGITNPAGTKYVDSAFSFSTDIQGSGSVTKNFPSTAFSAGANTNLTGTYTVTGNRTLPGVMTNIVSTSFTIGLTNATSYGRFQTVNVQTAGWANNQNVTVTITNPSAAIVTQWLNQNLTTGIFTGNWVIPWNAPMGTYTVTAVNATGNNKAISSTQTFTVGSAALTVNFNTPSIATQMRTNTVTAIFNITYPDNTLYTNTTRFSSITVGAYYNTTLVATVSLTAADYMSNGNWSVSWKIPRNAALGIGYKFQIAKNGIVDTNANEGPTAAVSSTTFAVIAAPLTVQVTQQPAINYTRTQVAMANVNITYPDNTFFTDADLGSVLVRVYRNATNIANVTLVADDFNNVTNIWTVGWASPYNSVLGTGYNFTVLANAVKDATTTNMGPAANVTTNNFTLLVVAINVAAIDTDATTYSPGEYVRIFFDAEYADGAPVITGTSTVVLTAPDTFSTITVNPVHTSAGRWQVTVWLSDAQAQIGSWNISLGVNGLNDGAGNMGPATAVMNSFTVLEAEVNLEDLMAAINALDDRLSDVEADTGSTGSQLTTLSTTVSNLQGLINTLQTNLNSLSATAATDADVATVNAAVSALNSAIAGIETKVNALTTAVNNAATDADVAAVNAAVDELSTDIAALETKLNTLTSTTASSDDLTAATDDISSQIGGLNTMVIVAVVLALIAAIAAILAVYIIQRKIAG